MITSPLRLRRLAQVLAAAALALALLMSLRPSAEAANYTEWVAQVPGDNPTSAQSVRVWINSDTAFGETIRVEYQIGGSSYWVDGHFDNTTYSGATWYADIPAQPNGTTVTYELETYNQSNQLYRQSGFNWSYTVNDGDVQWNGLKHDTYDDYYRYPFGAVEVGQNVSIRFRTVPLDVDSVEILVYTYDPAANATTGPVTVPMVYLEDRDEGGTNYAIWDANLSSTGPAILYYHFRVTDGLDVDYYSDDHGGPHDNLNQGGTGAAGDTQGAEGFQLTVYDPAFQTPTWLQNAVVYQIFPDRFRNGDPANDYCAGGSNPGDPNCPMFYGNQDIRVREPWNTLIGDARDPGSPYFNEYGTQFYGGDLQGLIDKLDYLQAAGFDTIYTTPIFDGSSNHRYDTDDYLAIDPALGDLATFDYLISELDARGMRLIVDGVFNHTSSDSLYFDRYGRYGSDGACESLGSAYRDWFKFFNNDAPCGAGDYEGWFGYDTLAVLEDENAEVRDFIYRDPDSVVETWNDRGVHGWRFDVADEISHDWWRDFRSQIKAGAPNSPLVGEVWPDASAFLLGDQLDSVMNYRFRKNVLGFVRQAGFEDNDNNGNNEIIALSPSQFDRALRSVREDYPPEATLAMLNLLDSHDTNRALYLMEIQGDSGLSEAKQRLALAALFQYTYMGAPMVYYGDEVGLDSPSLANHPSNGPEDDPYNRAPYPWEDQDGDNDIYGPADADLLAHYTLLAQVRSQYGVLSGNGFETLLTGDTTGSGSDNTTYAYARSGGGPDAIVALNPGGAANTAVVPVGGHYSNGDVLEDMLSGDLYTVSGGNVTLNLPARSGRLLAPVTTTVTVEKYVFDDPTGLADWEFTGPSGSFTLPAAGGTDSFEVPFGTPLTISETPVHDWRAEVYCDNGAAGGSSVEVTLVEGEDVICSFYNSYVPPTTADLTITKTTDPAGGTDFPFTLDPDVPVFAGKWGETGSGEGQFNGPSTVAVDGSGNVYVVDFSNHRIQKFDADGAFLTAWGGYGTGDSEFAGLFGVAVDGSGNVYVSDVGNHRIQKFDADGGYLDQWGSFGTDDDQLSYPHGVAVDGAGNVYVVDNGAHRIKKFDANGTYLGQWGSEGTGDGQFYLPQGIAIDGAGNVYVADTYNVRIQKFDANGTYLGQWGSPGIGSGQFSRPFNIAVDGSGNVYVADVDNHIVQMFDGDGVFLAQWGDRGDGDGQFSSPTGVAVDSLGKVYVADSSNNRVQKFSPTGPVLDDGQSYTYTGLAAGTYEIGELVPGGWVVSDISCDGGSPVENGDSVSVTLAIGDDVTCAFSNGSAATGDLTVTKVVVGDAPGAEWAFTGTLGPTFLPAVGGSGTYSDQAAGDYTIEETYVPGWATTVSCTPGGETGGRSVTLTLDDGETAACTFTNTLCQPGYYDNGTACTPADPGHYVDVAGAVAQNACVPGYYQPASAAVQCIEADAGYYVDSPAATAQTACPAGTTSPAGSDSAADCVVAATTATLTIVKETNPDSGTGFPFSILMDKWGSKGEGNGQFAFPYRIAVDGAGNVYVADSDSHRIEKFNGDGEFIAAWGRDVVSGNAETNYEVCTAAQTCKAGTSGGGNGQFNGPYGIAIDSAGNVYVADRNNHRVQKFDDDGTFIAAWGYAVLTGGPASYVVCTAAQTCRAGFSGSGNGHFSSPVGVAVDSAGNVFTLESGNHRIQKFDTNGGYLTKWGSLGSGNGQFNTPQSVAVDGAGNVYVADYGNNRVQKFDGVGTFLAAWGWDVVSGSPTTYEVCNASQTCKVGTQGSGNGQMYLPTGVAADSAGNVFVADTSNNRIQRFDTDGSYVGKWGSQGSEDDQFSGLQGVAVDSAGNVYVADTGNVRILKFQAKSGFMLDDGGSQVITGLAAGTYQINEPALNNWTLTDATCDGGSPVAGSRGVSVTLAAGDEVICTITNGAPPRLTVAKVTNPAGGAGFNFAVALSAPVYLTRWGSLGTGNGQFNSPQSAAVDSAGNVYVADRGNNRIQKFTAAGVYVTRWGSAGSGNSQFSNPYGVAVDSAGNVYVADRGNHRIQKFTSAGVYVTQWGGSGSGNGQFSNPAGVAVDSAGNVYVADYTNQRVQKFDAAGTFLAAWGRDVVSGNGETGYEVCTAAQTCKAGSQGAGNGQFYAPTGVAVDSAGNVYVLELGNNRVQKFDANGGYLTKWGSLGSGNGQFRSPEGLAVDSAGNVYVADTGNYRIQKFTAGGAFLAQWGSLGSGNGLFNTPGGVAVDSTGNVYVADTFNYRIQKFSPQTSLTLNHGGSFTYTNLAPGVNQITETPAANWTLSDIACDGGSPNESGNVVSLTLAVGDVVTCTFTNTNPPPTVTINQAPGQADPTGSSPINFRVVFSELVNNFATGDVTLSGTAGATTATVTAISPFNGTTYNVAVSGMTGSGTVVASIAAGVANDNTGGGNTASTSTDDTVTYNAPDTTAPETTIDSGPASLTNNNDPSFTFSSDEPGSSFECALDDNSEASFAACASPQGYTDLADGAHTFYVRAKDAAGNTDATPDEHSWTIDTAGPDTTITAGPTGTVSSPDATFEFESDDAAATFQCQLDGGTTEECDDGDAAYTGLSDGPHTFSVFACDAVGNCDAIPATRTWTIDTTGPDTTITAGPTGTVSSPDATFEFESDDAAATFQCQLDGGGFAACDSPEEYTGLSDGPHTFSVFACDAVGNCDATPATRTWTIDTAGPDTTITAGPTGTVSSPDATFEFESDDAAATFQCQLDGGTAEECDDGDAAYTGLSDGSHTFSVFACDAVGNCDATPATRTWTIDTTAPDTTITSGPTGTVNSASATFEFESDDAAATFQCQLDGGTAEECDDGDAAYTGLSDGSHTFSVFACDAVGNCDATPATRTWTVDTAGPVVTITAAPSALTNNNDPSFAFEAESGVTFQCQLDSNPFEDCDSPRNYSDVADGEHTFTVQATDGAGNTGAADSHTWTIDTAGPVATITSAPDDPDNSVNASFAFSSESGATFECQIDNGGFSACDSTEEYFGLSEGEHTFEVRAIDTAGNTGAADSHTWTVDTTGPDTTITSGPTGTVNSASATFEFESEPGATFQCQLDNGPWEQCDDGDATYTGLSDDGHTFRVQATDAAGNTGPIASRTWTVDTIGPWALITATPDDPTNSTSATFTFEGEAGATFECKLDDGDWEACSSGVAYTNLSEGEHTFQVRAVDGAGNAGPAESYTWTVDTTAPDTAITGHPPAVTASAEATFQFETYDPGNKLWCVLDGGTPFECSSPRTFDGLTGGLHTFSVYAEDAAGNVDATPATWQWTVDTTGPVVSIDSGPEGTVNSDDATFTFSSEDGATFECRLDVNEWVPCDSPWAYNNLLDGPHTLDVRATDTLGNTGGITSRSWTIDTTGPEVTITGGPSGTVASNSATFTFTSEDGATFECKLDGGSFAPCASPENYSGLDNGPHTFTVRATDTLGNLGAEASRTWTVDASGPVVTITAGPTGTINVNSATLEFTSESGATFECKLDGGSFAACDSPQSYSGLSDGLHTFTVRATDTVGNTGAEASRTWTVDTTGPVVNITGGPSGTVVSNAATFTFTSEGGATFECKLDGGSFVSCTSPQSYSGLSDGPHTFTVRATDALGNLGPDASRAWTVDTPEPTGALYVTASGGTIPGLGRYQKNDILKWDGTAWSVWFDGAGKTAATADIIAFDVVDEAAGTVYLSFRQPQRNLNGLAVRLEAQDIAYWNGSSYSFFLDGSDVGLSLAGERINGIEVLPGSVSPIGTGCLYYVLISTNAGGSVRNGTQPAITFTGEDVLGLCLTSSGPNTAGLWHLALEGQGEGLPKNGTVGLSANADATTYYFTVRTAFVGENGLVRPSQLVSFTNHTMSAPLWRAADHGLTQQVDGIDVVGTVP